MENLPQIIDYAGTSQKPSLHFIKRANTHCQRPDQRLGIFAASFNPVTRAHLELMRRAARDFALDETLALAGLTNADKSQYDSSLADRLQMLALALGTEDGVSLGLSSHAFFVDMLEALAPVYERHTQPYFILGFDTFERLLDRNDKYTGLYYRKYGNRLEALEYLLAHSHLLVAARAGARQKELQVLLAELPLALQQRILYLDFPVELGEHSSTRVRERVRAGLPIDTLVLPAVEQYIKEQGLYLPS